LAVGRLRGLPARVSRHAVVHRRPRRPPNRRTPHPRDQRTWCLPAVQRHPGRMPRPGGPGVRLLGGPAPRPRPSPAVRPRLHPRTHQPPTSSHRLPAHPGGDGTRGRVVDGARVQRRRPRPPPCPGIAATPLHNHPTRPKPCSTWPDRARSPVAGRPPRSGIATPHPRPTGTDRSNGGGRRSGQPASNLPLEGLALDPLVENCRQPRLRVVSPMIDQPSARGHPPADSVRHRRRSGAEREGAGP
jgi:hypothetical protein